VIGQEPTGEPVADFVPPAGTSHVVRVFADGVEQHAGHDYDLLDGLVVRFHRPRVARPRITAVGNALAALWVSVTPAGEELTAEVRRDGRVAVVDLVPRTR
jgi:hypothetical protein